MDRKINENFNEDFSENLDGNLRQNQTEKRNEHQRRLIQDIREELYHQTLANDVSEFSPKKVEYLIGLLDMENAANGQEIEKSQKRFEEYFLRKMRRKIQLDRIRKYRRRFAGACIALVILFITADVTIKAVMDESLFHIIK